MHTRRRRITFMVIGAAAALGAAFGAQAAGVHILAIAPVSDRVTANDSSAAHHAAGNEGRGVIGNDSWGVIGNDSWGVIANDSWGVTG